MDHTEHTTVCQVVNISDKPITIPSRTAVASIFPADIVSGDTQMTNTSFQDAHVFSVDNDESCVSMDDKLAALRTLGFNLTRGDLTAEQFAELVDLLYEYKAAFVQDVRDMPGVSDVEYNITLQPGATLKRQRQYRYPPHMREIIREQLLDWEKAGIIAEGDAKYTHPIVLVRKKSPYTADKNSPPKYRICLDLRAINKIMVVESYPIPTFNSIIESFGDPPPSYYSCLDALSGFLQIKTTDESSRVLGLESDSKTYVMKRIPFGLVTSPFVYKKTDEQTADRISIHFCVRVFR